MKKYLLTTILGLAMSLLIATPIFAATMSFSPAAINAVNGKDFTAVISIDPQGTPIYTAKAEINFPDDLVSVKSFTLANNWMALTQSGFDSIDNANGVMVKSAGYPGGISSPVVLGTIVFSGKASGSGVISTTGNSLVYDANSQNVLTGNAQISLAVSAAPKTANATKVTNPAPVTAPSSQLVPSTTPAPQQNAVAVPSQQIANTQQASLLSIFGNLLTLGTNKMWVAVLLVIVLLMIVAYVAFITMKGREKQT
jgi:hypothetical protein